MERLVKLIARSGAASRRKAGDLVKAGRVTVNGRVADNPALAVDPESDHVKIDGKHIPNLAPYVYVLLHKPAGVVTTRSDPEGRMTVMDLLKNVKAPVFPVGRLDMDTEGLLLLTNDGDAAQRLTHPRYGVRKVYLAKVKGRITKEALDALQAGVKLKDGSAKAERLSVVTRDKANTTVRLAVQEGRQRLVRRMLDAVGFPVIRLVREQFGPLDLSDIARGKFRYANERELALLRKAIGR